jgi:autotransporter-associated beta strand protein
MLAAAAVSAQTLTITNGTVTTAGFTNTVVTMAGQCALIITGTNQPLSSSTINLTSSNAWIFLPYIRPSVVSANYLSQVLVNGAAAVVGSNCRLDEYVMGSVIVPHPPTITPLQVFSGPNFLGSSTNLGLYTYYTNSVLGTFVWNISSFHLQRGYSATFAQYPDGTGASKVFVAQDGDLDVGLMPTNLDHQCNFIRVFPWHWIGKKGWGGGPPATVIDPLWYYDWNNAGASTLDNEYVPMKWGATTTWDPMSNITSLQGSTEVLGYNEPDSSSQANVTISNAAAYWPYMMQSGLRLGAPAVSSSGVTGQGLEWLYGFMNLVTNLGYRVDYIPIHFYDCDWSATQFSNYIAGVYQVTGLPVWVTEFNYGADWCSDAPTESEEATDISSYIQMLESTPFVERYAIYSYFATNRTMIVNNVLTPAGTNYLQQQSSMAYAQAAPPGGSRGIAQYQFENNARDSSGFGNNALAVGVPGYGAGVTGQAVQLDGTNNYLRLPTTIATNANFTFAAWVYWNGGAAWQRIFDFGNGTAQYMFLTPDSSSGTLRFAMTTNTYSNEQRVETTALTSGAWYHVALTIAGSTVTLYTNGVAAAASSSFTISPASFLPALNNLGKSQFSGDPLFSGLLDNVLIADSAFTATQIAGLLTNAPPAFTNSVLSGGSAAIGVAYSGSLAGAAVVTNVGDTLTYAKSSGPAWLTVAANGTLSGTPGATDGGTNTFTVRATDTAGLSAYALLTIIVPLTSGNGIWYADAAGNWSDPSKWTRDCPASGAGLTADFSVINISANRTVTLDSARSIGNMKFADFSNSALWTLAASGGSVLTLNSGSAASPAIVVGAWPTLSTTNAAMISASLAGTNGFTKSGWGTLVLSGGNSLSGTLNVDSGSASANDGDLELVAAGAATNLTAIAIRNNNGGRSTLQLAGGAMSPAAITLNGRNVSVAAIENLSGSNALSGNLAISVGGGDYLLQSDAGTLGLGGIVSAAASGSRTFTFAGAGDCYVFGSIQNGSATVSVTKQDAGNLILANTNTFTGGLTVGGGAVKLNLPLALQNSAVNLACAGSNGLKFGPLTAASVGSLAGINDVWLTNSTQAAVTLTNGANNGSGVFAGAFRGAGSLVKAGTGTLTLDGSNTYSGATLITAGTLKFGVATNYTAELQPVLWLSFDQAGNGVVTNQGTGGLAMNGAIVGAGAYVTNSGRFGNALFINGVGTNTATNIVQINSKVVDTSVSGNWTLSCWIKTTTAGAVILYQGDGGWASSGQTSFFLNANSGSTAGTAAGAVRWAGGFLTGTKALNDGTWHFITLVDSAGSETIYVDGVVDTVTSTMSLALASDANQIWIGGSPDTDAAAVKMTGMLDEVCLFSRALSLAEIHGLYTNAPLAGRLPAAPVSLASGATLDLSGLPQSIGPLSDYNGAGGVVTNGSATAVTLAIGNNTSVAASFSGSIADASLASAISVVKAGSSTQTLAGTSKYHGTTTVSNGTLIVNGTLIGNGTLNGNAFSVFGGTLGGNGVIPGPVTVYSGGTLSPGSNAIGTLTISNTLTLAGTTYLEINPALATNDLITGLSAINYGGTLSVANLAGTLATNTSFKVFSAASYTGAFAATNLPALGLGLGWVFDPAGGRLSVVQLVAVTPPTLAWSLAGSTLTFSWPSDHTGWRLLMQTNNLASGLSENPADWMSVPGASLTNQLSLPLDPTQPGGFYQLIYP